VVFTDIKRLYRAFVGFSVCREIVGPLNHRPTVDGWVNAAEFVPAFDFAPYYIHDAKAILQQHRRRRNLAEHPEPEHFPIPPKNSKTQAAVTFLRRHHDTDLQMQRNRTPKMMAYRIIMTYSRSLSLHLSGRIIYFNYGSSRRGGGSGSGGGNGINQPVVWWP